MLVAIKMHETVHIIPHLLVMGMEYVTSIKMDFYASYCVNLATDISTDNFASLKNQNMPSRLCKTTRQGASPDTSTCYNCVKLNHFAYSP